MRVIVHVERTIKYEIEVVPDESNTVGEAIAVARRSIEDGSREGVLSFWDDEGGLDFDVEVLEGED
jgi:hypothetical protein